ncbi:MAG: glycosidase [Archaeoglobales archaeon]|nr:MAG: glycosidase [Archaeoglobales archaeon]
MFEYLCDLDRILSLRKRKTIDIVKRRAVITANRVHLRKFPAHNPVSIFNASMIADGEELIIYGRIILGYFTYASAVAEIKMNIGDIYGDSSEHYIAEIVVYPDSKFDIWGVEDPRVYELDGKRYMTYCGRTVRYFDPHVRVERTLPVTAVFEGGWRKLYVFRMPPNIRNFVVSDKDAFLVRNKGGLKLFHRPHISGLEEEKFYLAISKVEDLPQKFSEINVQGTVIVMEPAKFEERVGWSTPPVKVDSEYLFLLHAIDSEKKCYRVFAMLMDDETITAITPHYIMEPRENYEIYGDRPFVVFPCGAQLIDDKLLISYGAADSAVGIGEIDISELMSILDSNRIE